MEVRASEDWYTAWAQPTGSGGSTFFFVEDNYVTHSTTSAPGALTDGGLGGKFVVRHNHLYNLHLANHGTEGTPRGGRAMEIYNNDFHASMEPRIHRAGCVAADFFSTITPGTATHYRRLVRCQCSE